MIFASSLWISFLWSCPSSIMLFLDPPPRAGAAAWFCGWPIAGLHQGMLPVPALFSPPFQVISCILFVNTTSPTSVNISSLTSVTPFIATPVFDRGKEGETLVPSWPLHAVCWLRAGGVQQPLDRRKGSKKPALFDVLQRAQCGSALEVFNISLPAAVAWVTFCFYISVPNCLCLGQRIFFPFSILCRFDCLDQQWCVSALLVGVISFVQSL